MTDIITITQAQTMSSLQIAELTGKQHSHIMRDIRALLEQGVQESNFGLSYTIRQLPNGGSKQEPYYQLTKTGCLILASGYNAVLREKIINRWIELETEAAKQYQVPTSFREALLLAAAQQEQIEEQQRLLVAQGQTIADQNVAIAELHERTSYLDQILNSKSTVTTTQIAQDYGMSAKKFNIELRNLKIQRKVGGQWILYAPYNTMGYVHSETFIPECSTTGKVVMTTKWTQKGRLFLYETLKKKGVLPLIER
jgi:Rha family phage regulatory protein